VSGARSRRKGAHFERKMVRAFRDALGDVSVRRGFQARSGTEAPDVDVPGWWPECKHHRRVNVVAALAQAAVAAPPGRTPVAICKHDREPPLVALHLADLLALLGRAPGTEPWWIETKARQRPNITATLRQAIATAPVGRLPVALCTRDHTRPIAGLRLPDFLSLVANSREVGP